MDGGFDSVEALLLLTLDRCDDSSAVSVCSKLAKPDTLPCSSGQSTIQNWDGKTDTDGAALDMAGHIVRSFISMNVKVALGNHTVKRGCHVLSHIRITIFIECQPSRSMLEEKM